MIEGRQVAIDALRKHHSDALSKAKEFRKLAGRQTTKEEADLYIQQAHEEEAKAQGYLRHVEILSEGED